MIRKLPSLAVALLIAAGACGRGTNHNDDTALNNDLSLAAQARGSLDTLSPAERAAACALREDVSWMRELVTRAVQNRERFAAALRANGLYPLPSAANFLLVPIPNAAMVAQHMLERGIAVRPYSGLPGIGDALRITIGPWPMMELALDALVSTRATVVTTGQAR